MIKTLTSMWMKRHQCQFLPQALTYAFQVPATGGRRLLSVPTLHLALAHRRWEPRHWNQAWREYLPYLLPGAATITNIQCHTTSSPFSSQVPISGHRPTTSYTHNLHLFQSPPGRRCPPFLSRLNPLRRRSRRPILLVTAAMTSSRYPNGTMTLMLIKGHQG